MSTAATKVVDGAEATVQGHPRSSPLRHAAGEGRWRGAQDAILAAGLVLVMLLILRPAIGLAVMWNVLIPVAPALIVVAPGVWRNVCPMATFSLIPRRLGISRGNILTRRRAGILALMGVSALFLIVPLRHISLNTNGPMTALMLVTAAGIAIAMGMAFEWRSGWCTSLCPIHPVEKLYGFSPAVTVRNARCVSCRRCTVPCPDSTRSMTAVVTGPLPLDRWLGHGLTGSFVGFIWGWYQLPDYQGPIGVSEIAVSYLLPFGGGLATLAAYTLLRKLLGGSKTTRNLLARVFAAAAVCTYYWYRLPALGGFGPHSGTGQLYDLTGLLPDWTPWLSHGLTTLFFVWFLIFRQGNNASWMTRPPVRD